MKSIMVDNWFMEEVIADICDNKIRYSQPYAELLMAIVLWDDVYYPQNTYNWWNSVPSQVQNILRPIDDRDESGLYQSRKIFQEYKNIFDGDLSWVKRNGIQNVESDVVGVGALRYMMLSNDNECDYLPCTKRRLFLQEYNSGQWTRKALSRLRMQKDLDKSIVEYYYETYKALIDFSGLNLEMPVLANYIIDNASEEMSPIDYAFHLKNEGPVIKYRRYLSQVEGALEKQEWSELRFLLRCSHDAVSDVISVDSKKLVNVSASILPTPSVVLKHRGISAEISSKPTMTFEGSLNKLHLTFLKDLTKYAINDRHFW